MWRGDTAELGLAALVEDQSLIPNIHIGQLTVVFNSSSKEPDALSGLCGHLCR